MLNKDGEPEGINDSMKEELLAKAEVSIISPIAKVVIIDNVDEVATEHGQAVAETSVAKPTTSNPGIQIGDSLDDFAILECQAKADAYVAAPKPFSKNCRTLLGITWISCMMLSLSRCWPL